jgi:hypothetical protein
LRVALQVVEVSLPRGGQFSLLEMVSFWMRAVALSGTRGAAIGKEAVATTELSEFELESVAF